MLGEQVLGLAERQAELGDGGQRAQGRERVGAHGVVGHRDVDVTEGIELGGGERIDELADLAAQRRGLVGLDPDSDGLPRRPLVVDDPFVGVPPHGGVAGGVAGGSVHRPHDVVEGVDAGVGREVGELVVGREDELEGAGPIAVEVEARLGSQLAAGGEDHEEQRADGGGDPGLAPGRADPRPARRRGAARTSRACRGRSGQVAPEPTDREGVSTPIAPDVSGPGGRRDRRPLGRILLDAGVVDEEQLEEALGERATGRRGERLGAVVTRLGYATDEEIAEALATQLGLEFVREIPDGLVSDVPPGVPSDLAQRHHVAPLSWDGDTLVILTSDPTDVLALDDLALAANAREVRPVVATPEVTADALDQACGLGRRTDLPDLEAAPAAADEPAEPEEPDLDEVRTDDAPAVRLGDQILTEAARAGASDIHLEPGKHGVGVRIRVDGVLRTLTHVGNGMAGALVSRLKLLAGMDIAERRLPQDGRWQVRVHGEPLDIRASAMPTLHGETVVLRLLRQGDEQLTLDDLDLDAGQRTLIERAVESPQGLVLVTGPTGSGKTSTLYAVLRRIAAETRNVLTLEDPIEYQLEGVNQTQINERIGLTFATSLRSVLRQDPDVVMLGEIRDTETAELALQAALTGHLVLSTLHTNDAPAAVSRLRDLGVPSFLVSSALTLVVAQRLVRRVCDRCAEPCEPDQHTLDALQIGAARLRDATVTRGRGCRRCGGSGYRGRRALMELMPVGGALPELIAGGAAEAAIREHARVAGLRSLREHGVALALEGETTLEEVLRVAPGNVGAEGACPGCAQTVEPDFAWCPWCGADLRPLACAQCERELRYGWQVCPTCGATQPEDADGAVDRERLLAELGME